MLGDPALLQRPWDPATCQDPLLRQEVWDWLEEFVVWFNREYVWDPNAGMIRPRRNHHAATRPVMRHALGAHVGGGPAPALPRLGGLRSRDPQKQSRGSGWKSSTVAAAISLRRSAPTKPTIKQGTVAGASQTGFSASGCRGVGGGAGGQHVEQQWWLQGRGASESAAVLPADAS